MTKDEQKYKIKMQEITYKIYQTYVEQYDHIAIEDQKIDLKPIQIDRLQPTTDELTNVSTTVWSFPKRGAWATHRGDYRGNWAPQIPRALMLMYTKPGDVVVDPMIGSGTTAIEAKLLGRNCIAVDISFPAVILTFHRLYYLEKYIERLDGYINKDRAESSWGISKEDLDLIKKVWTKIYHGDARNLDKIRDNSVDLIATHPPYFNIIKYGKKQRVEGDLSKAKNLQEYLDWMYRIAKEFYRILKPRKYCAILIGDTRTKKHYVPISHYVLDVFLKAGFILKEEVIKIQHKMKTTREIWSRTSSRDFLLIYHEKLFIFRKPESENEYKKYKYSCQYWKNKINKNG
ncbi:MAG: TRM11 family methyltransferase [Candidatus Njordarchaeota archaeon]